MRALMTRGATTLLDLLGCDLGGCDFFDLGGFFRFRLFSVWMFSGVLLYLIDA